MEIARFNKRVFAFLIDFLFPITIGVILSLPLFIYLKDMPWFFALMIMALICYVTYLIINIPIMYFSKGSSIGSFIFKIKTVKKDGGNISFRNIVVKHLYVGLLPFIIANAIYMLVVHTEQTLFDRITNSIVIDLNNSPSLNSTVDQEENNK